MTNNTGLYWEANGLSLHTYAWSVSTFGGRRYVPPNKRGEDLQFPFRKGRKYVRKTRDMQIQNLKMWMVPLSTDGTRDTGKTIDQKFHENWNTILAAVDVDGQFPLVKRWWEGTTVKTATATAEYVGGIEPQVEGMRAEFELEFLMADPYFYVAKSAVAIGTITVEGNATSDHIVLSLSAGTNPKVTFPDGNWVRYAGTVGGTPAIINCATGTAKIGSTYVNGLIERNTAFPEWPTMAPGSNALVLSGTGGPAGTIAYDAAYR